MADGVGDFNGGHLVLNTQDRDCDPPASALIQLKAGRHGPGIDGNATGEGDGPVAISTILRNKLSVLFFNFMHTTAIRIIFLKF